MTETKQVNKTIFQTLILFAIFFIFDLLLMGPDRIRDLPTDDSEIIFLR